MTEVVVYDPAGLNPYGSEVAALLRGVQVNLLTSVSFDRNPANVRVLRRLPSNLSAPKWRQALAFGSALTCLVRFLAADATIVVVWTRNIVDACLLALAGALWRRRLVFVIHNPVPRDPGGLFSQFVQRVIARNARVVVAHDAVLAEAALRESGASRVRVCRHPMYTSLLQEAVGVISRSADGQRRVVLLGAWRHDKGFDDVIRVLRRVSRRDLTNMRLILIGKGSPSQAFLRDLAELGASIEVIGGKEFAPHEVVVAELRRADCLLAPFRGITTSASVVTALSVGCPVVAYDVGSVGDFVEGGQLAQPGDPQGLANILVATLRRSERNGPSHQRLATWNSAASEEWSSAVLAAAGAT
jgi:glycosyltransferase involved in cell wall biosynthesis